MIEEMATYGHLKTSGNRNQSSRTCCGFSARFIHYFLFIFNFIFLLSGVLILLLTLLYGRPHIDFGETHLSAIRSFVRSSHLVNLIHYSMIVCGITICLIAVINAIIGCCRHSTDVSNDGTNEFETEMPLTSTRIATRDRHNNNQKSGNPSIFLCFFIFGLLFLFTLQLIIGLVAFISVTPNSEGKDEFILSLSENLNTSELLETHKNELESLYVPFKCCGWTFFDDYEINNKSNAVPDTCCKTIILNCGQRKHPSNIYYDGCIEKFGPILKEYVLILGSVALGFSIVEVFGLIFSCCLYVQLAAK
jgi:hypothetical protein